MTTPNLQLNEFGSAGVPSGADLSDSMRRLDAVVQMSASAFTSDPPAIAALGDRLIVDPPGTGVFAGHDLHVAYKTQNGWEFIIPEHGWTAIVGTPPVQYIFDSSIPGWVTYEPPSLQDLSIVRTVGARFVRGGAEVTAPADSVQVQVPFSGTIVKVSMSGSGGPGSAEVDIWKSASYPAGAGNSIVGGSILPAISSSILYEDEYLVDWELEVTEGDWIAFNLESSSIFTGLFIQLHIRVPL